MTVPCLEQKSESSEVTPQIFAYLEVVRKWERPTARGRQFRWIDSWETPTAATRVAASSVQDDASVFRRNTKTSAAAACAKFPDVLRANSRLFRF